MRVRWETLDGDKYEGTPVELDSNVLYVKLDSGEIKPVEMDCVVEVEE